MGDIAIPINITYIYMRDLGNKGDSGGRRIKCKARKSIGSEDVDREDLEIRKKAERKAQ